MKNSSTRHVVGTYIDPEIAPPELVAAAWYPGSKFPEPPPALQRGISEADDRLLLQMAMRDCRILIVRDSNPQATRWIGDPRAIPKPAAVKAKTLRSGPAAGLACAAGATQEEVDQILTAGFIIQAGTHIITDRNGKLLHSDLDLHGIYDTAGRDAWSDSLLGELFQHPPHDNWAARNDARKSGANFGPQPPVTAYMPDGTQQWLTSVRDMRAFYLANALPWELIYPLSLRCYGR